MKLLSVYNICGLSGIEQTPTYIDHIKSLIFQKMDSHKVVISGCMTTDGTKAQLQGMFLDHISYSWIEEPHPLSVTFNDTIDKCVKHYGEFDGYLYVDSGVSWWDPLARFDAVQTLWDIHISGPNAITAAFPSNDDGSAWWKIVYEQGKDYVVPVGKATNMHAQIFSEEWRKAYNRILPDIFGSNCMESVFANMAAAIHKRYIVTQKVHLQHLHSMDGASLASRKISEDFMPLSSQFPVGGTLYKSKRDMDKRFREGYKFGFGWEECAEYWRHDPDKFDENGFAKDPELKNFLARELYLNNDELDYSKIKSLWVPGWKD